MDRGLLTLVSSYSPDEVVKRVKHVLNKDKGCTSRPDDSNNLLETSISSVTSELNDETIDEFKLTDGFVETFDDIELSDVNNAAGSDVKLSDGNDVIIDNAGKADNENVGNASSSDIITGGYQRQRLTSTAQAKIANEQKLVCFDEKAKTFSVRSLDRKVVQAVHMADPKVLFRCSCPSAVENCSHVLAVKVYLGIV